MLNVSAVSSHSKFFSPINFISTGQIVLQPKTAIPRIDLNPNSAEFLTKVYGAGGAISQGVDDTLTIIGNRVEEHDFMQAMLDLVFGAKH